MTVTYLPYYGVIGFSHIVTISKDGKEEAIRSTNANTITLNLMKIITPAQRKSLSILMKKKEPGTIASDGSLLITNKN